MKLPIPDDWSGEWCRFCVCWPKSPQWQAILLGFITLPQRGWTWREEPDKIPIVQAIGREITASNLPLQEVALTCQEADLLVRSNLMLIAAITGTDINLSAIPDLAAYVNQHHNFLAIGLANRLGPTVQASSSNTIQATLNRLKEAVDELKAVVAAGSPGPNEDLEDDLAKVWGALDDITEVLGGAVSAPIEPL